MYKKEIQKKIDDQLLKDLMHNKEILQIKDDLENERIKKEN